MDELYSYDAGHDLVFVHRTPAYIIWLYFKVSVF